MVSISLHRFDRLVGFLGYGNPAGKYWFIGLEEGFKAKNPAAADDELRHEIEVRARWSDVEDIHHTRATLGLNMRGGSPAWYAMSLIALKLDGAENWRTPTAYKEDRLARLNGDTFLTELFPLPAKDHSEQNWPYATPFSSRAACEVAILPRRIELIRGLMSRHGPRYVFCYGKGDNWRQFKELYPGAYVQLVDRDGNYGGTEEAKPTDQAQIVRFGSSLIVCSWHLSGMNYDPLGQLADAVLTYESASL